MQSYSLRLPDYAIFVAFLILYACVGIWYGNKKKIIRIINKLRKKVISSDDPVTTEELFLGNRNIGILRILGTTMASFISAVSLLGSCSEIYLYGMEYYAIIFGYLIAFPLSAEVYMPVFYKLNLSSTNEYLEMRFSKAVRGIVTIVFILQMLIYMSVVLYAPSLALAQATGWDVNVAIITTGLLATLYTSIGGIRAVVLTDLIQIFVMLVGFIMIIAIGSSKLGGIEEVFNVARGGRRLDMFNFDFNPFIRHSFFALAFGGAGMVLSVYATNQTQVQRYLACKNLKTTKIAIHLNLPLNAIFLLLQVIVGLVAYATFFECDPKLTGEIGNYDQILPYLIMKLFNEIDVIRGIFISSIFAAALSTLSSGINSMSCVLVEDVLLEICLKFRKGFKIRQRKLTIIARCLALVVGIIVIMGAFLLSTVPSRILQFTFSIFGAIGGPIFTVFTIGILLPFVNEWGGFFGFAASLATGLTMTFGSIFAATYKQTPLIPVNADSCMNISASTNVTTPIAVPFNFFNLSYLYYCPFCLVVGLLVASIVSLATGLNSKKPISYSLLAWQAVWLYSRFPSSVPPQSCPSEVTSNLAGKLAVLIKADVTEIESDERKSISERISF